jgi:hypothetical protein
MKMNLQQFITQSLVEIMNGLKDAQTGLQDSHARICPMFSNAITPGGQQQLLGITPNNRPISAIEYDVAVEVSTNSAGGGGLEITVANVISGGGFLKKTRADKDACRVKFSVPVCYPEKGEVAPANQTR